MVENTIAIKAEGLCEYYKIKFSYPDKSIYKDIKALENIDFEIKKGETIALLGPNGAGKTTLLKLIAGIIKPSSGAIDVKGKVQGIFALEAGFIPDLTGYENLKLVLKLHESEDEAVLKKIIEFSELGDFVYAPLKAYSQGMYLRLTFSLAIHLSPDILIIDDILAVGDYHFQKKCMKRIKEITSSKKTVVLVTHNLDLAEQLCSRCIVLEKGKVFAEGRIGDMRNVFLEIAGDIWGSSCIKNKDLNVVFNNGKLVLRYRGVPLTVDLGVFYSFKKNGSTFFSTDFKWEVKEDKDSLVAYGSNREDEEVCRINLELNNEGIDFNLESKYPELEINFMLKDAYLEVQIDGDLIELPPVERETTRDWKKIFEATTNNLKLKPELSRGYPEISFVVYSDEKAKAEFFNHFFYTSMRIVRIKTLQPRINVRMLLNPVEDREKSGIDLKDNSALQELAKLINKSLIEIGFLKVSLFKKINFISHLQREAFEDFECELLHRSKLSNLQMIIKFPKIDVSLLLIVDIDSKDLMFKFSAVTPTAAESLTGIGFILDSDAKYRYYSSSILEGAIGKDASLLTTDAFNISSLNKHMPELNFVFNSSIGLEIVEDNYYKGATNLKFLPNLRDGDFEIKIKI